MPPVQFFEWLDAGGNLALFALVWIMWKFDRRLVKLETIMAALMKKGTSHED